MQSNFTHLTHKQDREVKKLQSSLQFRTSQQIGKIIQINLKYEVRSKFNQ